MLQILTGVLLWNSKPLWISDAQETHYVDNTNTYGEATYEKRSTGNADTIQGSNYITQ